MRVENLMAKQVHSCRPEDTLEQAARLMWSFDCGSLPVCGGAGADRPAGMITDRDISMCALFQHKPLSDLRVSEAMSKQVLTCRADDPVEHAEQVMRDGQVRRLPVLNDEGALVGVISLADIAREAARERAQPSKDVTELEVGDTLAAICVPPPRALAA